MKKTTMQKAIKKYCYKSDFTEVNNKQFIIDYSGCYNAKQSTIVNLIKKYFNVTDFRSIPQLNVFYYSI